MWFHLLIIFYHLIIYSLQGKGLTRQVVRYKNCNVEKSFCANEVTGNQRSAAFNTAQGRAKKGEGL